jgi:hypothetical protein
MSNADYAAYVQAPPSSSDALATLTNLAEKQAQVEADVKDLEAKLSAKREELRDVSERQVPELMDSLNLAEFKTASGLKIEVAETIRASIPQALAPRAFAWLRENGNAAMIKRAISVAFGRGQDATADSLVGELANKGFDVEDKTSVHPSTLSAFVREKLRDGAELPLDLFGVHRQRASKIKN